tara:strand:- start:16657 stop:16965 length:309 start_codon:yes stop_codon:yes gene_type:complete
MEVMQTEYSIDDWDSITSHFETIFGNLGEVEHTESYIRFSSYSSDVKTNININKSGDFDASMPLHGVKGMVKQVIFTENTVQLIGQSLNYTYRIPPEILKRR